MAANEKDPGVPGRDPSAGGRVLLIVALAGDAGADELHAALVRDLFSWTAACHQASGCTGYVLSRRIADADIDGFSDQRGWAPAPRGLIQFTFADEAQARHALRTGENLLPPSARMLVDTARSSLFLARETAVFAALSESDRWKAAADADAPVKMVVQNWRRPDLSFAQFSDHWRNVHAALVRDHGPNMGFRRYVQSHRIDAANDKAVPAGWGLSPDGGMTEVWWTSHAAMKQALASAEAQTASALFAADERNFVHPPRMTAMLARETRVVLADPATAPG